MPKKKPANIKTLLNSHFQSERARFEDAVIRERGFLSAFTNTHAPWPDDLPRLGNSKPWEVLQHKVVLGLSFPDRDPCQTYSLGDKDYTSQTRGKRCWCFTAWADTDLMDRADVGAALSLHELHDYGPNCCFEEREERL